MELEYSVAERKLTETVDTGFVKSSSARQFDFQGPRQFELVFGIDVEVIARFILFEYEYSEGQIEILWTPSEPYVFDLPTR